MRACTYTNDTRGKYEKYIDGWARRIYDFVYEKEENIISLSSGVGIDKAHPRDEALTVETCLQELSILPALKKLEFVLATVDSGLILCIVFICLTHPPSRVVYLTTNANQHGTRYTLFLTPGFNFGRPTSITSYFLLYPFAIISEAQK